METAKKKRIDELHFEHSLWLNQIGFYRDELTLYVKRLEEIASKNTGAEIGAMIEHFQNNFIRQREVLDTLRHDIKAHENNLAKEAQRHPVAADHRLYTDHDGLREQMETFGKLYSELKAEFTRFVSKSL